MMPRRQNLARKSCLFAALFIAILSACQSGGEVILANPAEARFAFNGANLTLRAPKDYCFAPASFQRRPARSQPSSDAIDIIAAPCTAETGEHFIAYGVAPNSRELDPTDLPQAISDLGFTPRQSPKGVYFWQWGDAVNQAMIFSPRVVISVRVERLGGRANDTTGKLVEEAVKINE